MRGYLRALALLFGLSVLAPRPALAHGRLKSSSPSAGAHLGTVPPELRLDFSESPELMFTMVRLVGPDGREVSLRPIRFAADSRRSIVTAVAGPMIAGIYTVMWQMAGDDGHPVRGKYEFVVAPGAMGIGVPPAGVDAAQGRATSAMRDSMHHDPVSMPEGNGFGSESTAYVVIRWLQFIGLLLAIGAVSFRFFVIGALRRASDEQADVAPVIAGAERRAADIGWIATGLLAITLLLRLGAQSYAMHGAADVFDVGLVAQMVQRTTWGWGWLVQLVGVLCAGAAFHVSRRTGNVVEPDDPKAVRDRAFWWRIAAVGAMLAAVAPALSGHAASAPRLRALVTAADWLHVLSASSWLGTLAVLLAAGLTTARRQAENVRGTFIRSLVNAFSPVALVSAGLASVTGVFAAWIHVGTIPNLWGTRYGITLLVKLGVLAVVAITGFYNWRYVQPQLGTDAATARLKRSATVEVTVALLVLLVTAILVASPTSMDMNM